jgi:small conductance mechanosensitive channel
MSSGGSENTRPQRAAKGRRTVFEILEIIAVLLALFVVIIALHVGGSAIPSRYVLPTYYGVVAIFAGYIVIRVATVVLEREVEPHLGVTGTHGIKNLIQILGVIVVGVVISGIFGFNLTSVLIGAGFAGIVLGLAAQQVLGNVFAGVLLIVSRPFDIGDRVTLVNGSYSLMGTTYSHESQLNGVTGTVSDLGIFLTHVMLDEGIPAVIPNSVIIASLIVNHSLVTWRTVRVRLDLTRDKVDFNEFRSRILNALGKFDIIEPDKSSVEIVDVSPAAYSVVVQVCAKTRFEDPVKTMVIQEAMRVQRALETEEEEREKSGEREQEDDS